jgi:SulP family sulfate permease
VALTIAALASLALARAVPGFEVATINTRFSYEAAGVRHPGIPREPPRPVLPWRLPGRDGAPLRMSLDLLRELMPAAFAIAMLGAIESLLSATVADGMTRRKHDPDAELMAQGIGNVVAPFFGGIAAAGAIARTATNIRSGAHSPLAAVFHSFVVLSVVLLLAPGLGYLPMASLAALLLMVAWNMSDSHHFAHLLRVAPRSDVAVLLTCFALTVVFDMTVSVPAGVLMAALLFMRRMAEVSGVELVGEGHPGPGGAPAARRRPLRHRGAPLLRRRPEGHALAAGHGRAPRADRHPRLGARSRHRRDRDRGPPIARGAAQ